MKKEKRDIHCENHLSVENRKWKIGNGFFVNNRCLYRKSVEFQTSYE